MGRRRWRVGSSLWQRGRRTLGKRAEMRGFRGWGSAKRLNGKDLADRECREYPLPALLLKRYDSKRVRGWWLVNDMISWDLRGKRRDIEGVGRTAWRRRMARRAQRDSPDLIRPL